VAAIALLLMAAVDAGAAPVTLEWSTLDSGGDIAMRGGTWQLDATIGQPDANPLGPATGGPYALEGGFWPGVVPAAGATPGGDTLFANGFE
jgi:hypothetical protein